MRLFQVYKVRLLLGVFPGTSQRFLFRYELLSRVVQIALGFLTWNFRIDIPKKIGRLKLGKLGLKVIYVTLYSFIYTYIYIYNM